MFPAMRSCNAKREAVRSSAPSVPTSRKSTTARMVFLAFGMASIAVGPSCGDGSGSQGGGGAGTSGTAGTTSGTCQGACAHYLGCKGVSDAASVQTCTTSCDAQGYAATDLADFERTDCATAIQFVEGTSGGGATGGTNCSGCVWDGSACTWFSASGAALSGLVQPCDAACCPGH